MIKKDGFSSCECPVHGQRRQRARCSMCNAAYMKGYMRRRRVEMPALQLWERARRRARDRGIRFALPRTEIIVPSICPALGIPITVGGTRSDGSPSLDRVLPTRGYVQGNVRVISDRANRLKSDLTGPELRARAFVGSGGLRNEYCLIAAYVDREILLAEIWIKARQGGRAGEEWAKLGLALDRLFHRATTRH